MDYSQRQNGAGIDCMLSQGVSVVKLSATVKEAVADAEIENSEEEAAKQRAATTVHVTSQKTIRFRKFVTCSFLK
jgi:hypothetical protein